MTVERGFPTEYVKVIESQLASLNKEFGFYPNVVLKNDKVLFEGKHKIEIGYCLPQQNKIELANINPKAIVNDGYMLDHEYGHLFDVRVMPTDKDIKAMLKLNPGNAYFEKKLAQKQLEIKDFKASPHYQKWKRLDEIYKTLKKDLPKGLAKEIYRFTNIKEFAAEVFCGYRRGKKFLRQDLYDEAYKLIISLPQVKKIK